jgi:phosphatidylserine/phosphatidylglycerophosphate/cardiolipin synthase-like enzyme
MIREAAREKVKDLKILPPRPKRSHMGKRKFLCAALFFAPVLAFADDLQYLDHSELALARLYTDISNAQSTIDLTYLMWDPCSSASKVIMKKLREKIHPRKSAANPHPVPVKVRMLIDSYFHRGDLGPMATYFSQAGIDMKFFNPSESPTGGNDHSHSKMALIDHAVPGKARLVTGGRNLTDDYYGMGTRNYVDRDVGVVAPSSVEDKNGTMASAASGFDRLWNNRMSKKVAPVPRSEMGHIGACTKWTARDAALEKYLQANAAKILASEKPVTCGNVRFTIDDMKHTDTDGVIRDADGTRHRDHLAFKPTSKAVLDLVAHARHRLTMENQYFIPDDDHMKGLLRRKKREGVKIDLYSNMFESGAPIVTAFNRDFEMVALWQQHYMEEEDGGGERNHMNFRIAGILDQWKFTPKNASYSYHAKTFVADGTDAIVSSFNIDPRSMNINGESALTVKACPAFAGKVERITQLTGKVWTMEENLQVCLGYQRPRPQSPDPLMAIVQLFTKGLQ